MSQAAHVLLVDDDPIMRELASAKLCADGYKVLLAENGVDAATILKNNKIDLLIVDLNMPLLNGFDLTRMVREDARLKDLPVIVITGSDHSETIDNAFAAGATSFLAKPINWTLFNHSVRFVLRAGENQRALRSAMDQARAGAQFKENLMSMMSHELRTPLNAIIGFGQILSERFSKENDHLHKEYADYVTDGGRRLLDTVSDILLASDAASGAIKINSAQMPLSEIIDRVLAETERQCDVANALIEVSPVEPDLMVDCDVMLVVRALAKLIDNSVKFSPNGVRITLGAGLVSSGALAIAVRDDGPGLSAERLALAMKPFSQSDMSLTRSSEGLGLGVPLVNAIAQAHKGMFRLTSTEGEGAQAVFVLPKSRIEAMPVQEKRAFLAG